MRLRPILANSLKGPFSNGLHIVRKCDRRQVKATRKRLVPDAGYAISNCCCCQLHAIVKRFNPDARHAVRNGNRSQSGTPGNAESQMLVTLSGIVTDASSEQPENAPKPMLVTGQPPREEGKCISPEREVEELSRTASPFQTEKIHVMPSLTSVSAKPARMKRKTTGQRQFPSSFSFLALRRGSPGMRDGVQRDVA